MKHGTYLAGLLAVALVAPAWGQITIDQSPLQEQLGKTRALTAYEAISPAGLQGIIGATGAGQTYDFSAVAYKVSFWATQEYLASPTGVPGGDDSHLAQANLVIKQIMSTTGEPTPADADSTSWSFGKLQSDGFYQLGSVMPVDMNEDGTLEMWVLKYVPALLTTKFPLTFGTSWTQVVTMQSPFYNQQVTNTYEVDGWGTLVTPAGSAACLRLRHVDERSIPFIGGVTRTTTLSFVTLGNVEASVTLDQAGQPVSATYLVFEGGGGGQTAVEARAWGEVKRQTR
jgi:hypothetical protein